MGYDGDEDKTEDVVIDIYEPPESGRSKNRIVNSKSIKSQVTDIKKILLEPVLREHGLIGLKEAADEYIKQRGTLAYLMEVVAKVIPFNSIDESENSDASREIVITSESIREMLRSRREEKKLGESIDQ